MEGKCCFATGSGLGTQRWGKLHGHSNYNLRPYLWHRTRLRFLNKQRMEFCGGKKHFTHEVITKGPVLLRLFDVEWIWSPCCKMFGLGCQRATCRDKTCVAKTHTHAPHIVLLFCEAEPLDCSDWVSTLEQEPALRGQMTSLVYATIFLIERGRGLGPVGSGLFLQGWTGGVGHFLLFEKVLLLQAVPCREDESVSFSPSYLFLSLLT